MLNALTALPERLDNRPQAEGTAQFVFEKQAVRLLPPWIRRMLKAAHRSNKSMQNYAEHDFAV